MIELHFSGQETPAETATIGGGDNVATEEKDVAVGEASGDDPSEDKVGVVVVKDVVEELRFVIKDCCNSDAGDTRAGLFSISFFQAAVCDNNSRLLEALGMDASVPIQRL